MPPAAPGPHRRSPDPGRPTARPAARLASAVALALSAGLLSAPVTLAAPAAETEGAPATAPQPLADSAPSPATYEDGTYVVVLEDDPTATYDGGIEGLAPTATDAPADFSADSAAVRAHADHAAAEQEEVAASVGAEPLVTYSLTTNGFAAELDGAQAARLADDPRVDRLVPNELLQVQDLSPSSTEFLGLEGPDGTWAEVGGPEEAGAGVVVGVIDTGIAPENPSFAGEPLSSEPSTTTPYLDGDEIIVEKADGSQFRSRCVEGDAFDAEDCSTKLVGARYFVEGFGERAVAGAERGEHLSPRDGNGHGSHVASTAAGEHAVDAAGRRVSGVAPGAVVSTYKACWTGVSGDGCATVDLLAAIEAATRDGVDVLNFSIGSGSGATSTVEVTDEAFLAAAATGVFVAAAGGNSGPWSSSVDNAAPWITTVAASTIPAPEATVELGDGTRLLGTSVTVPEGGVPATPLVDARAAGLDGVDATLCASGTLDPAVVTGTVVLCDRGTVARTDKSVEVARAGGVGMVLVNPTPSSLDTDEHAVPTVHVDADVREALRTYAGTEGATAAMLAGNQAGVPSPPAPQIAGFSSRGPLRVDGSDLIKPDLAAPGTTIYAALANAEDAEPVWGYRSGTSMASPHVAGLGALYYGAHEGASPAEAKSALMTSATPAVDAEGQPLEDPFAQGNGQVVPRSYLDPGLLYLNGPSDWESYRAGIGLGRSDVEPVDASDLNLASLAVGELPGVQTLTRTVTSTRAGTWTAEVSGLAGVEAVVEPATLSFDAPGQTATFEVSFTRTDAPLQQWVSGALTWVPEEAGRPSARSAVAVRPVAVGVPAEVRGEGQQSSVTWQPQLGEASSLELGVAGLTRGATARGEGREGRRADRYAVEVPDGATHLRLALDAEDDAADLDLTVYLRDEDGSVYPVAGTRSPAADEVVDLSLPWGGTYVAAVEVVDGGQQETVPYALTSYVVTDDVDGELVLDPDLLVGDVGATPAVTASWDVEPGQYLGLVSYGRTGNVTAVAVDAGEPVAEPGELSLTVTPSGPDEWATVGFDLAVRATGLTPGERYTARVAGSDVAQSGQARVDGTISWSLSLGEELEPGAQTLVLSGPGVELSRDFLLSPVSISPGWYELQPALTGTQRVVLTVSTQGSGDVRFRLTDAETGEVAFEEVQPTEDGVLFLRSSPAAVPVGRYVGRAEVVLPDGTTGPGQSVEDVVVEAAEASTVTVTPTEEPGRVRLDVDNRTGGGATVQVTYRGCDGRLVDAWDSFAPGTSQEVWTVEGFTSLEVRDFFGDVVTRYDNDGPSRCAPVAEELIGQDLWTTRTAEPGADGEEPVDLAVSHRHPLGASLYTLRVGLGEPDASSPFLDVVVPVDPADGTTVTTTPTTLPAEQDAWVTVSYETFDGVWRVWRQLTLELGGVGVEDLAPEGALVPGTPTVAGEAVVGQTLTGEPGTWAPAEVELSYQWLRDGEPIRRATSAQYELSRHDAGHPISLQVTGTLPDGQQVVAASEPVTVLSAFRRAPVPVVRGPWRVGSELTAIPGRWSPAPVELSYQWLRDGEPVEGATGRTYVLQPADAGAALSVRTTATREGYATASQTSAERTVRR
ncbi:S8 family serine peptidase [Pseudokineococcus sp. 1T1Z-3]|uniref:S8 family serine peptidase n=1 Tax=Pseudokineococcus sp. 1T1Z-3 TaxID=3132745 RepID=UPI0030AAB6AE